MLQLTALLLVAQIQVPPPRGYVNDFAAVLDSASVAHMEAVITEVRAKTRGEIAVVTLPDIADRPAADVARSEEHTSELQSRLHLVCRLLLEKKKKKTKDTTLPQCTTEV